MRPLVLILVSLAACGFEPLKGEPIAYPVELARSGSQALTAVVDVENGLPYDGCSYPISISGVRHAASPATKQLVSNFATRIGTTKATITYRLTGGTTTVECGWGSQQILPEIEVLSIVAVVSSGLATITNGLPYDGCSYPVEVNGVRYAPTAASKGLVETYASQRTGTMSVTVDYLLPGTMGQVECGWGGKELLPEIDVKAIRP